MVYVRDEDARVSRHSTDRSANCMQEIVHRPLVSGIDSHGAVDVKAQDTLSFVSCIVPSDERFQALFSAAFDLDSLLQCPSITTIITPGHAAGHQKQGAPNEEAHNYL